MLNINTMKKPTQYISFINFLQPGEVFYYVNVEMFKEAREYSHVDFYKHTVLKSTRRSVTFTTEVTSGWQQPTTKRKLLKKDMRLFDRLNDYAAGYKKNYDQAMFFLLKYREMFVETNPLLPEADREYYLEFCTNAIAKIQWYDLAKITPIAYADNTQAS